VLSAGTLISFTVAVFYLWVFPSREYPQWPHFLLLSFYIFCLLLFLGVLISFFDKTTREDTDLTLTTSAKTSRYVLIWWLILAIVMISFYIIFNGH